MSAHEPKSIPAEPGLAAPNPIHVVGAIAAKDLAAARAEALQPFHLALDEAERNLRSLLPKDRSSGRDRPAARLALTDESPAFQRARARRVGPAGPFGPAGPVGSVDTAAAPSFELWAPWYVDADAAGQPA